MLYTGLGRLLARAAAMLAESESGGDAKTQRANRGLVVLLRRLGVAWPGIFRALRDETAVLEATRGRARAVAAAHGIEVAAEPASQDPVEHYGGLERELEDFVARFHEVDAGWARDALRDVRAGLLEAAEIQGVVIEDMLAH